MTHGLPWDVEVIVGKPSFRDSLGNTRYVFKSSKYYCNMDFLKNNGCAKYHCWSNYERPIRPKMGRSFFSIFGKFYCVISQDFLPDNLNTNFNKGMSFIFEILSHLVLWEMVRTSCNQNGTSIYLVVSTKSGRFQALAAS